MCALISATVAREHIETDLSDAALERVLEAADADIVRSYGPHSGVMVETFTPRAESYLFVSRAVDTVSTITETFVGSLGETSVVLDASDYAVEANGRQLRRLVSGTNPAMVWAGMVTVEFNPVLDNERRALVLIDLAKLMLAFEGVSGESIAGVSVSHADYARERQRILRRLAPPVIGQFA